MEKYGENTLKICLKYGKIQRKCLENTEKIRRKYVENAENIWKKYVENTEKIRRSCITCKKFRTFNFRQLSLIKNALAALIKLLIKLLHIINFTASNKCFISIAIFLNVISD